MSSGAAPDLVAEGARVADAAAAAGLHFRLVGGVAIALCCPSAGHEPLLRDYADIDGAGLSAERDALTELMTGLGYRADQQFNLLQGSRRLLFWDEPSGRQLDVFLDEVEMCHRVRLDQRLDLEGRTLPLADLLLLKLQVVETNRKDLVDVVTLLADHPLTQDESGINVRYLAELTGDDWGLWRTATMIAGRAREFAVSLPGLGEAAERVRVRIDELQAALEHSEKTRRWRWRARIGERKRWYELPEEVG